MALRRRRLKGALSKACIENEGLELAPQVGSDQSMVLTVLEVIGFTAMLPTHLRKNAYFGQPICHMQQFSGGLIR